MFDVTISDIRPELIFQIGQLLAASDLNALVQTNKRFYQNLDSSLWRQNADLALLWAAENGDMKSARKALKFGANINTEHPPTEEEGYEPWETLYNEHDKSGATPLFLAAAAGQVEMVKLFVGIDAIDSRYLGWNIIYIR
jgi:ankyrin repeat protein